MGNKAPYTIGTVAPLDVLGVGLVCDEWFRIPSRRVEFHCESLKNIDVRIHKSITRESGWVLSEATTGFKIYDGFGDQDPETLMALFCDAVLPKLTREKIDSSMARAREQLIKRKPSPFAALASGQKGS